MTRTSSSDAGDGAIRKLLLRYDCPTPLHVVRMRFWGAIVSPVPTTSPVATIESLWADGAPVMRDARELDVFLQAMMGLWNSLTSLEHGPLPPPLRPVGKLDTRERLHAAATMRVEELLDGFMEGFTGGEDGIDVPLGVAAMMHRVERGIELIAMARNTFAAPPRPDDAAMVATLAAAFPGIDRAIRADLEAIANAVMDRRRSHLHGAPGRGRAPRSKPAKRRRASKLH